MYGFYFIEHDPVLSVFIFVNRYALTSTSCCFLVIMCQAGDTTLRYLKTLVFVSWRKTLYTHVCVDSLYFKTAECFK